MATIALYANKINQMPGLIKDVKKTVSDYKSELFSLKSKTLTINKNICNLDDVTSSIQSSTLLQEQKMESLEKFNQKSEQFITGTVHVDQNVAEVVNKNKKDFYKAFPYLKPDSEKSGWEKFCDGVKKVGEWCKDHWKICATIAIIVVLGVLSVLTGGALAVILAGAFWGALSGALISGTMGGISSAVNGGSFFEGFANDALSGAITGGIFGGIFGVGNAIANSCKLLGKIGALAKLFPSAAKIVVNIANMSSKVALSMLAFDLISWGTGLVYPNNPLTMFNKELHSNNIYNSIQLGTSVIAVFSAGFIKGMKNPVCFVAGTLILTASGYVAIEDIKAGDKVISAHPDTCEKAEKTVLETYMRETKEFVHLSIAKEIITTTKDHPFYVNDQGFKLAGELHVGDELLNSNGNVILIENIKKEYTVKPMKVYNFQVESFHTYHVGNSGILVHNSGQCKGRIDAKDKGAGGAKSFLNSDTKAINNMTKGQLKESIPKDWNYYENNGRIHIKDANGNFRVRIDQADNVTRYQHMHIFDANGNSLDINGNIVGKKSPDGHIPWNK